MTSLVYLLQYQLHLLDITDTDTKIKHHPMMSDTDYQSNFQCITTYNVPFTILYSIAYTHHM